MKVLINVLIIPILVASLVTGCGQSSDSVPVSSLSQMQDLMNSQTPTAVQTAKGLDLGQLNSMLNSIAASGQITPAQAATITNPTNQAVLQAVLQLAASGNSNNELAAVSAVLAAASTGSGLGAIITDIINVLTSIAPIVETLFPAAAPFISAALAVLPLVETVLNALFPPAAA